MGTCGCGDMNPIAAYRVAPDRILVIDEYHGCDFCNTPLGISIHLFTEEEAKNWHVGEIREFTPDEYGHEQKDFALIGEEEMERAAKKLEGENGKLIIHLKDDQYDSLEDFMHDHGLRLIQEAMRLRPVKRAKG